jgi:hypothetical protein
MNFYEEAWAVADENNWTDNALLHALLEVLETESLECQERVLSGLEREGE